MERLLVAGEPLHEFHEAALAKKVSSFFSPSRLMLDRDRDALVQECELPQAGPPASCNGTRAREDLGVRLEANGRAGAPRLAEDLQLLTVLPRTNAIRYRLPLRSTTTRDAR